MRSTGESKSPWDPQLQQQNSQASSRANTVGTANQMGAKRLAGRPMQAAGGTHHTADPPELVSGFLKLDGLTLTQLLSGHAVAGGQPAQVCSSLWGWARAAREWGGPREQAASSALHADLVLSNECEAAACPHLRSLVDDRLLQALPPLKAGQEVCADLHMLQLDPGPVRQQYCGQGTVADGEGEGGV